jgi:iron only hydrogenase large subunit-like protein
MGGIFHSVYLDSSLCVGCTTCIKHCPTEAIRVREGKAHITEERCIDCGECIRICPKGAKKSLSDPLSLMDGYDVKAALPAPSLYGQFGPDHRPSEVFEALGALGFDEVFDVAWGAWILAGAIRDYAVGAGIRPLISSACPVVVRLIQQRFPSLIANLVPFLPPMEAAARELRRRFSAVCAESGATEPQAQLKPQPRLGIFFISPCTSKVTAIRNPLGYAHSEVDAVFSFKDIYVPLRSALKSGRRREESAFGGGRVGRMIGLGAGLGWARSDGELDALGIEGAVSVDGIANVIALLEELDNGKLQDIPYIEALACPGGCVGGPMAVANPHVARSTIKALARDEAMPGSGDGAPRLAKPAFGLGWEAEPPPRPLEPLDRDIAKALAMEEAIGIRTAELPGLDCGACGAPDCRALAEDIVKGLADESFCLVRMRRTAAT